MEHDQKSSGGGGDADPRALSHCEKCGCALGPAPNERWVLVQAWRVGHQPGTAVPSAPVGALCMDCFRAGV